MRIEIAEPCGEDWSAMTPDRRGRFCGRCQESVVDLARLTRRDAERMVRGGALCAQIAVDETGRTVFAPEPILPARLAKVALRLAVIGALAGCEPPRDAEPAAPTEADGTADAAPPTDAEIEPRLSIGEPGQLGGSLMTGQGGTIPLAPPRLGDAPLSIPALVPPAHSLPANRPPANAPPTQTIATPHEDPAPHELRPSVQHLRGRIAIHPH